MRSKELAHIVWDDISYNEVTVVRQATMTMANYYNGMNNEGAYLLYKYDQLDEMELPNSDILLVVRDNDRKEEHQKIMYWFRAFARFHNFIESFEKPRSLFPLYNPQLVLVLGWHAHMNVYAVLRPVHGIQKRICVNNHTLVFG